VTRDSPSEWEQLQEAGALTLVVRCDVSEPMHAKRLAALVHSAPAGVWHAAGVVADSLLPAQTADSLASVYAPKAHGAWTLQQVCAPSLLRTCALFSSVAA